MVILKIFFLIQKENIYTSTQIYVLTVLQWSNNAHVHHTTEKAVEFWNNSRKKITIAH